MSCLLADQVLASATASYKVSTVGVVSLVFPVRVAWVSFG